MYRSIRHAVSVTPSDTGEFGSTSGIYIGGAGTAIVTTSAGDTVILTGLLAGTIYPFSITAVKLTGTTATGIMALYIKE